MVVYDGKGASSGIAIGTIKIYQKEAQTVARLRIEDTKAETARFHKGREEAQKQLEKLYEKALLEVGEANAAIFEVHRMMLEDPDYTESIENMIETQGVNAEYAVASTGDNFAQMFSQMEDTYMRERAADVKDISERLIAILRGDKKEKEEYDQPVILVAEDLTPSETVQLDKSKVISFVTVQGVSNSHTAILARTMGIPALIGVKVPLDDTLDGKMAVSDGFDGKLIVSPSEDVLQEYQDKVKELERKKQLLQSLKGKETVTSDGKQIKLYANVGSVADVMSALQNDAAGIGLFRSEFLYLEKDRYPTQEEQFQVYKSVVENMAGRRVIIRTCDIGADKQVDYFDVPKEENPALGYRAIRICLDRKEMFKDQLKAIFRASAFGKVAIMYPMIISVEEVLQIKAIVEEVKTELDASGIEYGLVEQGIMIETPAAAVMSDALAKEVDFFSIGTNDLTQYTLAIDRQNPLLEKINDTHHPALLRMVEWVVKCAHKEGIWAGICGELGADLSLTETFLKMGVDEFSVTPNAILPVREKIRASAAQG